MFTPRKHIASADPKDAPAADPRYFDEAIDLDIMVDSWKFTREVTHSAPFKDLMVAQVAPGPEVASDDEIRGEQTHR